MKKPVKIEDQNLRRARLCGIVGVAMLAWTVLSTGDIWTLLWKGIDAEGTVIRMERQINASATTAATRVSYAPVFKFNSRSGLEYTIFSGFYREPTSYAVGQRVPVIYDPAAPSRARIYGFWEMWFLPSVLGGNTLTFILCSFYYGRLYRLSHK